MGRSANVSRKQKTAIELYLELMAEEKQVQTGIGF